MVLLDAALEVLATASGPPAAELVEHCGDTVVVTGTDGEQHVVRRHSLPDLRTVDERALGAAASRERIVDLACRPDGRVAALTSAGDDPHRGLTVHEDLFGAGTWPLPPAADAAFAGDGIVLLRSDREGGTSELELHDLGTREVSTLARFDGLDAYELTVAPGGGHLTVRRSADEPVLLVVDAASGETVARSTGEWMPVPEPWLDDRRLLLRDEDRGLGSPPGAAYRLVDVNLEEVRGFAAVAGLTHTGVAAVEGHVIGVGGAELAVVRPDGSVRASADPRTAAAWGAVLLGPVSPDAGTGGGVTAPEAPDPSPGATAGGDPPEAGAAWDAGRPGASRAVAALILLAAIGLLAGVPGARRWARKAAAATSWRTRSRGSRRRRGR